MKSIRTNPANHAVEGDERIRTAELSLGTDSAYEVIPGVEVVDQQIRSWGGWPADVVDTILMLTRDLERDDLAEAA